jgi:hypothetical protein
MTPVRVQKALSKRFGKTSQVLLTDSKLMEWLSWLEEQGQLMGHANILRIVNYHRKTSLETLAVPSA